MTNVNPFYRIHASPDAYRGLVTARFIMSLTFFEFTLREPQGDSTFNNQL